LKELDVTAWPGREDHLQLWIHDEREHEGCDSQQREQECRLALQAPHRLERYWMPTVVCQSFWMRVLLSVAHCRS